MDLFAFYITPVLASFLLTTVSAQNIDPGDGPGFSAPSLENANFAFYTILLLATLIQVICAISYIFRGSSPHLLPGIIAVVAFLLLGISYALGIAITVSAWTFDQASEQIVQGQAYLDIDIPAFLFFRWVDPAMFAVVALVLRDRYCTYTRHAALVAAADRPLSLLLFTLITWISITILLVTSSASAGIFGAAYTALYNNSISELQFATQIRLSSRFDHAFVAFSVLSTIFLVVFAITVKKRTKSDKIAAITLFYIIPFLGVRALARLIFEVVNALLPLSSSWEGNDAYALDLATTIVYGVLFFIVASILLYFFLAPGLWIGPDQQAPLGASPHQQFAYPLGGIHPSAQFPGQWAYSGQPQHYPAPDAPSQGMQGLYPSLPVADSNCNAKSEAPLQTWSDTVGDKTLPGVRPQ